MLQERVAHLRQTVDRLFPERRVYLRSGGEMRGFGLSQRQQLTLAGVAAGVVAWAAVATISLGANAVALHSADREAAQIKARYERLIADRQARLDAAVAQLSNTRGSVDELAADVESRHEALAMLMTELKDQPGAADALKPTLAAAPVSAAPAARIQRVRLSQEDLIAQAEAFAQTRAERLRLAFRLAGVSAKSAGRLQAGSGLGGPLVEARDPRALAAVLDVDPEFARRIQRAASDLAEMRTLTAAAETLPLAKPVDSARLTSSFGVRFDPFTTNPAFHSGQDFAASYMTPVEATAPGVVSYAGVRSGYGNTVEVDHGGGFKTRYAHLAKINVRPGQRVPLGAALGGMGSTGRSTGVHLHYEVWVNGRAQNPARFLKAGEYVRQG
jgi:murein DD-endopeptidase MepM/ murein hydrolase activator NlpD